MVKSQIFSAAPLRISLAPGRICHPPTSEKRHKCPEVKAFRRITGGDFGARNAKKHSHKIHGAGRKMLTWLGYIDGIHVTINIHIYIYSIHGSYGIWIAFFFAHELTKFDHKKHSLTITSNFWWPQLRIEARKIRKHSAIAGWTSHFRSVASKVTIQDI